MGYKFEFQETQNVLNMLQNWIVQLIVSKKKRPYVYSLI
jgi:hypothetical protein